MDNIDEILSQLNEEQIKPVLDTEGAVLVIAGAGSGKTRVLTSRIAYLIARKNVSPYEIMAITFTNKAAEEMKQRLRNMIGGAEGMWVSTIHSMCVRILRRDIDKIGFDKNFTIYDETDKDKALRRIFADLHLDPDKFLKTVKNNISTAKSECLSPDEYKNAYADYRFINEICGAYKAYEEYLAHSNSLDFDDLLFKTYQLFVNHPDVADYYSQKFRYIHIDEFQDTNKVQFFLARRLSQFHGNLFVVGDDDQSIYGWRGAKIENILDFDKLYSGAKIYKLERNYRSTKKILNLANCIIKNNTGRREKELWTENKEGVRVETFVGTDENSEASFAAMQIKALMARNLEMNYSDFAVFMRLNALSRAFEQEFTKYAIPYRIFGGFRFFERKEIKDIMAYLKVVNNISDNESFIRCVSSPSRGIGEKTLRDLREFSVSRGTSMYSAIDYLDESDIKGAAKTKLFNFRNLLASFKNFSETNGIERLITFILESTGFLEQFADKNEDNTDRLMNIGELKNSAEQYENENGASASLAEYLNSTTLSSDTDGMNEGNAVTVTTIHSAKGLEYPCVFVAGLDENVLPVSRSTDSDEDLEEERRLMYVAVTRAKERLYLTRARSRYMYGRREFMDESRFLREARPILSPMSVKAEKERAEYNEYSFGSSNYGGYDNGGFGGKGGYSKSVYGDEPLPSKTHGYSSSYAKNLLKDNKPKEQTSVNSGEYKAGIKVKHVKFGEGTVVSIKGSGENLIADVAFNGIGIKSLSVRFAPMEIMK